VPHITTGGLLRAAVDAGTPLGKVVGPIMAAGNLVSDDLMLGLLEERCTQPDTRNGFILDGYPRNLVQAAALDQLLERIRQPMDLAVQLEVDNEQIVERLAERARIDRGAQQPARGDVRHLQVLAQPRRLRAFARAGRTEKNQSHPLPLTDGRGPGACDAQQARDPETRTHGTVSPRLDIVGPPTGRATKPTLAGPPGQVNKTWPKA
jgi:adenylate kinase family enzyme